MPNHEEIYRLQAEKYEQMISRQPNVAPWIEEIRPVQGLDVLDLGAGTGRISVPLADKAGSLVSTDKSEAMLKVLKKRLLDKGIRHTSAVVADHRGLPLLSSSIDLAVSGWSVCYLTGSGTPDAHANLDQVMSELNRVIRPGGTIVIFETMGTGYEEPNPPDFLTDYYERLENLYGFSHRWVRMDYRFPDVAEAAELAGFFFGEQLADQVRSNNSPTLAECAGIWWKHLND